MVKLIHKKLKGNILEPMVALIIIVYSLTAAFTVVMQANQTNNVSIHIMAQQYASRLMNETIKEEAIINDEFEVEGLSIKKTISWFNADQNLLQVQLDIYDNKDKLLTSQKRIIIRDANK